MPPVSVVIADAQYLVRRGLNSLIEGEEGFEVVGEAIDIEDLENAFREQLPDMLILDHAGESLGLEAIDLCKRLSPGTRILVISSDEDKKLINDVLEHGVQSFLTKNCGEEEISDAIRATARGEKFFCTRVIDYLLERSFSREEDADCSPTPLTTREVEIVQLTAKGLIAKEIASQLNLSTHTVYTHRKNIMKKLQLNTSSELVLYAVNHGIVDRG